MNNIHLFSGGTYVDVANGLALCSPCDGWNGYCIESSIHEESLWSIGYNLIHHKTQMVDDNHSSSIRTNEDFFQRLNNVLDEEDTTHVILTSQICMYTPKLKAPYSFDGYTKGIMSSHAMQWDWSFGKDKPPLTRDTHMLELTRVYDYVSLFTEKRPDVKFSLFIEQTDVTAESLYEVIDDARNKYNLDIITAFDNVSKQYVTNSVNRGSTLDSSNNDFIKTFNYYFMESLDA